MSRRQPPRALLSLVRRCLPRDVRGESVCGDLIEEYGLRESGHWRDAWFALQGLRLAVGYGLWDRVRRRRGWRGDRGLGAPGLGGGPWLEVSHAARTLVRRPTFLLAGVVTLALGIGADTAIFSLVWHSALRPLSYPHPEQLVFLGDHPQDQPSNLWNMNIANFLELRERTRTFQSMAAFEYRSYLVGGEGDPARVLGLVVTHDFFDVLGRSPRLGRDFSPSDDVADASRVVILSDAMWRTHFGSDPQIVGKTVSIDLLPYHVIGVTAPDIAWRSAPALWTPYAWDAETRSARLRRRIWAVGRLDGGQTIESGVAELRSLFDDIRTAHPEPNQGLTVGGQDLHEWTVGWGRGLMQLLSGCAGLVLLIACINVANLMLARAHGRRAELATRRALGAGRYRAGCAFLSEALLLALAGGALGIPVAHGGVRLLIAIYGESVPLASMVRVSGTALAFACAASVGTGLVIGLVPAVAMDRRNLTDLLRGSGRGATRGGHVQDVLVMLEVALGVVLVATAGLLVNTALRLSRVDLGIAEGGALTFRLTVPESRYGGPGVANTFFESVARELAALPGVAAVGLATRDPLNGGTNGEFTTSREPDAKKLVETRGIISDWFPAVGQRVVAGRNLVPGDASSGGIVVNQALARALFGGEVEALGQQLRATWYDARWGIVGVVTDVRDFGPTETPRPTGYWPIGSDLHVTNSMAVLVRTTGVTPTPWLPAIRERVRTLDADLALSNISTLSSLAARTAGRERRTSLSLVATFAALALILSAIGIYAVIAFGVEESRRELGVRMALGADGRTVIALVCARGVRLAAVGLGIGFAGVLLAGRLVQHLLWQVRPADPLTLFTTALVFVLAALVGSAIPARRAASVRLSEILRQE